MGTVARRARRLGAWLVVVAALGGVAACGGDDSPPAPEGGSGPWSEVDPLPRLHAVRGERPGVFDEDGRQVVLRGVNLNGLAEYARADPDVEPTVPVTEQTWDQIAEEGFNAVRLLVSWSRLEPERGEIDDAYVDEVRTAVRHAAERGIYVIVDMHQDAWGPFVATPPEVECPPGREPANGWDGAPAWATPDAAAAGPGTCRPAEGESKPGSDLVVEAWDRFYRDADGVQSRLVAVWEHLATALADEPSVAGYDLLNEPGHGRGPTAPAAGLLTEFGPLGDYYARAIDAIRRAEADAGIEPRPVYFEHSVAGNQPPVGFSDDPGLVFSPHIYGGSIVTFLTVDQNWDAMLALADGYGTSIWVGEYGWWDDPASSPDLVERVERFATREDDAPEFVPVGSAWWQWNNGCGDPHQLTEAGAEPADEIRQYRVTTCVDGDAQDAGVVPEWRRIVARPAVRFAPGWLTGVTTDSVAGTLEVRGTDAEVGAELELWVPGDDEPELNGDGIADVEPTRHGRGWRVTAQVCAADYHAVVGAVPASGTAPEPAGPAPDRCD
jgi:endoglycosylceramidase